MTSDSCIRVSPFLLPNFYFPLLFVTTPCTAESGTLNSLARRGLVRSRLRAVFTAEAAVSAAESHF
jgi:hypothetical protein